MATHYSRRPRSGRRPARYESRPSDLLVAEAAQGLLGLFNAFMWVIAAALVTVLLVYAGLLWFADVDAVHLVRDYQQHMAGVRATATAGALGHAAPTAPARTYPTPAPLGTVPAAQPATGQGLTVADVHATAEVAAPAAAPAQLPAADVNSAPATLYQELPGGGTRVGGSWGDTPAEPAPAPQALAPQAQPTAIPANYNPPATSGGRSAGSWGAP